MELPELEAGGFEQTLVVVQAAQFAADSDQGHDVDIERPLTRLSVVHDIIHDDEPTSGSRRSVAVPEQLEARVLGPVTEHVLEDV